MENFGQVEINLTISGLNRHNHRRAWRQSTNIKKVKTPVTLVEDGTTLFDQCVSAHVFQNELELQQNEAHVYLEKKQEKPNSHL